MRKPNFYYDPNVVGFFVILLAFLIPLELILEVAFGVDTIFKPYRVVQVVLVWYFIAVSGFRFLSVSQFTSHLLWFVLIGILATILRYPLDAVDSFLLFNWLGLALLNISTFIIIGFVVLPLRKVKVAYFAYFASLVLNLWYIFFFNPDGDVRSSGFFDNSNSLGVAGVLGLILLIDAFARRWINFFVFCALLFSFFLLVNETGSRAAFFVFGLMVAVYLFSGFKRLVVAVIILGITAVLWEPQFTKAVQINALVRQKSKEIRGEDEIRYVLAQAAFSSAKDTNFLGLGISQFQNIDNFYKYVYPLDRYIAWERKSKDSGLVSHSTFIQVFAEFGIIGVIIFASFLLKLIRATLKDGKSPFKDVARNSGFWIVFSMLVYGISHVVLLNPLFWFFVGFASNGNLAYRTSRD